MLLVAGILVLISSNSQVMAAHDCKNKSALGSLVSQCSNYVKKSGPKHKPLPSCCKAVNAVDVGCVCALVTKDVEEMIDMEKVVYVARFCGKKIKSGTKCGSKFMYILINIYSKMILLLISNSFRLTINIDVGKRILYVSVKMCFCMSICRLYSARE